MNLELTDEETAALERELRQIVNDERPILKYSPHADGPRER
jgi:hypothetical protein